MTPPPRLATCSYTEFQPAMGVPIRTTVGAPRWSLPYQLVGTAKLLAPTRAMLGLPEDAYTLLYRRLLDQAGLPAITTQLTHLARGHHDQVLVLLCFDKLSDPGGWCHRSMFATWWQEQTGQEVPELGAHRHRPAPTPTSQDQLFE